MKRFLMEQTIGRLAAYIANQKYENFCESVQNSYLKAKAGRGDGIILLDRFTSTYQTILQTIGILIGIVLMVLLLAVYADLLDQGLKHLTYLLTAIFVPLVYLGYRVETRHALDYDDKCLIHVDSFFSWKKAKQLVLFSDVLMVALDMKEVNDGIFGEWHYQLVVVKKNGQKIPITAQTHYGDHLPSLGKVVAKAIGCAYGDGSKKEKPTIFGIKIQ